AAGVAHEVRNPLNILSTGIDYLSGDPALARDATATSVISELREAIRRADAVVCTLMDSSKGAGINLEEADINKLIDGALTLRQSELSKCGVKVTKELADN